eukprot:tig00000042_g15570.t1
MLERAGATTAAAEDGVEGVEAIKRSALGALDRPFSLVLMDCQKALEAHRLHRPHTGAAHASVEDHNQCLKAGMDFVMGKCNKLVGMTSLCITKPILKETLLSTVKNGSFLFPDAGLSEEQKSLIAALGFISNIAFVAILILLFFFCEERVFEKLRILMPWMAAPLSLLSDSKPADGETNANGEESSAGTIFSNLDGDGDGGGGDDGDGDEQQLEPDRPGYLEGRARRPLEWEAEGAPAAATSRLTDRPASVPPLWDSDGLGPGAGAGGAPGDPEGRVISRPPASGNADPAALPPSTSPSGVPTAPSIAADEDDDEEEAEQLKPAPSIAVSRPSSVFEFVARQSARGRHFDLVVETPGGARGAADLRPPASAAGSRTPSPGASPRSGGSARSARSAGRRQ